MYLTVTKEGVDMKIRWVVMLLTLIGVIVFLTAFTAWGGVPGVINPGGMMGGATVGTTTDTPSGNGNPGDMMGGAGGMQQMHQGEDGEKMLEQCEKLMGQGHEKMHQGNGKGHEKMHEQMHGDDTDGETETSL